MNPEPPGLRGQFVRGVLWTAAERWGVRLLSLVTFVLLARLLRPSQFGLVALASTFTTILTTVAEAGISTYIVRADDLDEARISSTFWTALLISVVAAAALAALSPVIGDALHQPTIAPYLAALSITLVGTGVSSVPMGLLQRDMAFGKLAGRAMGGAIASAFVGIFLALAGAGAWALVAQAIANIAVGAAVLWIRCPWRPTLAFSLTMALESLHFGAKVLTINVLIILRDQGDNLLIGTILGPVDLGYWTVATRILQILIELGVTVIQTVAVPAFARMKNDSARLLSAYSQATTAAAMVMLPLLVTVSVLSPDLVPALFGHKWAKAGTLSEILTLTGVFAMLVNFDQPVYFALGRPGLELALVTGIVGFHLAVTIAFAHLGLIPVAIALLGQSAITWLIRVQCLRRFAGIRWGAYSGLIPVIVASAICAGTVALARVYMSGTNLIALCIAGAVGLFVYTGVLFLTSETFREHLLPVRHLIRRRISGLT
jgi:PST family polysaccharide transporter